VVRLPHCYQPNDSGRAVAEPPSRAEAGLPERGFVLACFNQPYKIAPDLFALWMDLLRQVPGSVLWLIEALPQASANLKAAARRAGIAPERLVLAPPLPLPEHLARHALADLALDTTGYTGHTTTSDALWAGLPVITCRGRAMPARVAASLLGAAGLDDCIADDLPGYAALALSLARDPARLADLRARCAAARQSPLFDSAGYADALGRAFAEMDRRRRAGQAPAGFTVPV
jgi:predicted O-linked N-acetylglucosamine transferase (SPINDLY family)